MKDIGIVIATYNGEKYIQQQLESIINQSVKPDLIVVSDGGSQDKTISICREILKNTSISNIILTSDHQLNVTENFEKGFRACDSQIVFFSDQDDVWENDKIEKFYPYFDDNDVKMVFSNADLVDDNLINLKKNLWEFVGYKQKVKEKKYCTNSLELINILVRHNVVTGMCLAVSNDFRTILLPFSKFSIHDAWIAFAANGCGKVIALNENLVKYRQHIGNVIGASSSIRKSYHKKDRYLHNAYQRKLFIENILECNLFVDSSIDKILNRYIVHLDYRINFMKRKKNIFSIIFNIREYRRFEYQFVQILFKDLYIRLTKG